MYCGSAVAVGIVGGAARIRRTDQQEIRLATEPAAGSFTVLISSAAGFDRKLNPANAASRRLDEATVKGFTGILESSRSWWKDLWLKGFVHLCGGRDGVADMVEQHYLYYLYLMASTSRGRYMTKFNGMLWITNGDERKWGANQSCLYNTRAVQARHPP